MNSGSNIHNGEVQKPKIGKIELVVTLLML